jgi:hypothetical protein
MKTIIELVKNKMAAALNLHLNLLFFLKFWELVNLILISTMLVELKKQLINDITRKLVELI